MKIQWDTVPSSDIQTKQSLLLASGNYPDVFMAGSLSNSDVLKYSQEGIFVPLNDLIKKYAPNLWKAIQTTPGLKQEVFAPDGKIYALPSYNYCFFCSYSNIMWVNTDLLKKYDLQMPTTTAQLTHVLQVFKQHGIIPMTGDTDGWNGNPTNFLMNAFIYDANFDIDNSGKMYFAPTQEKWKQGLAYIHNLYAQNLLDHQAFSQQESVVEREVGQNKVGMVPEGDISHAIANFAQTGFGPWRPVPPLKGPNGVQYAGFSPPQPGSDVFAITNKASQAQEIKVMKLLNFIWTPDGTQMLNYGPEGKYWTKAKKGQLGLMGTQALYNMTAAGTAAFVTAGAQQNVSWYQMGPYDNAEVSRDGMVAAPPFTDAGLWSTLQLFSQESYAGHQPKYVYPSAVWIPSSENQQYSVYSTNINNFLQQWTTSFIDGSKSLDKDWNTYVQGLNHLGLQQYVKMSQDAMGKPFDTSAYKKDPADEKFLESLIKK